jgi:hypothetical protein
MPLFARVLRRIVTQRRKGKNKYGSRCFLAAFRPRFLSSLLRLRLAIAILRVSARESRNSAYALSPPFRTSS